MLAYSRLFKSILFCSFIFYSRLYHYIVSSYAGLVYSFLFYFIYLHSVMFFLSTLCFGSILLYIMSWIIHFFLFYSILLYSIDSVLTVVYWPLHFCSVLFSYILLTFIICHVQLCCSILFMHYSSIIFFKSILFILILLYSGVLFILSSVLVRSLLSLITCTTVGESHLLSNKNALGNVRVLIWAAEMFTHFK